MAGFEFVNITDPDDAKKHSTKVRRHVMKDIGRARRKPKPSRKEKCDEANAGVVEVHCSTKPSVKKRVVSVSVGEGRDMSGCVARATSPRAEGLISHVVYPIEMNEHKLGLVRLLVEEARSVWRPFRFTWLSMGVTGEAAWYITLANAAAWRSGDFGGLPHDVAGCPEAMSYYAKSLEPIAKRLSDFTDDDDKDTAEGLVIAVTGCLCHDTSVGNFERMDVHLKGLKQIVDTRGGLDQLSSPILRQAISWLDLNAATYLNSAPNFSPPRVASLGLDETAEDSPYLRALLERWDWQCPSLGDILDAIKTTAAVASYANKREHDADFWHDDITMTRLMGPALHKILTLEGRPLPQNPRDPVYSAVAAREAFRRAALMFMGNLKIRCRVGASELPRHLDAFRQISRLPLVEWSVVPELNMWAHIIAALQEGGGGERRWHVAIIVGIMYAMELRTGAEALDVARGVIWVNCIMDDKATGLERDIEAYLRADDISQHLEETPLDSQLPRSSSVTFGTPDVSSGILPIETLGTASTPEQ